MTISKSDNGSIAHTVDEILKNIQNTCVQCGRNESDIQLMAVTKTVDASRVNEAINAGITLLGENRAQELCAKYDEYKKDEVDIHFIGHLQSNKVRQIINKVSMIESLDNISLAKEIQRQCQKNQKTMNCLIEVNIGYEDSKSGVLPENLPQFIEGLAKFDCIKVQGIMSIPPICEEIYQKERYFANLYKLFIDIKEKKIDNINMDILSMGMSDDYLLAIKHGSNLVRIGSALFGLRNYTHNLK